VIENHVPSTFVDDEELLQPWLEKLLAYAKTLPPKPSKVKKEVIKYPAWEFFFTFKAII